MLCSLFNVNTRTWANVSTVVCRAVSAKSVQIHRGRLQGEVFVLPVMPDEWRAVARPTTERLQVLLRHSTSRHVLLRSPRFTTVY